MGLLSFISDRIDRGRVADVASQVQAGQLDPAQANYALAQATGDPSYLQNALSLQMQLANNQALYGSGQPSGQQAQPVQSQPAQTQQLPPVQDPSQPQLSALAGYGSSGDSNSSSPAPSTVYGALPQGGVSLPNQPSALASFNPAPQNYAQPQSASGGLPDSAPQIYKNIYANSLLFGRAPAEVQKGYLQYLHDLPEIVQKQNAISNNPNGAPTPPDGFEYIQGRLAPIPGYGNVIQQKAQSATAQAQAGNLAEAQKTLAVIQANLPSAMERFDALNADAKNASFGILADGLIHGGDGEGILPALRNSYTGGKTALANTDFLQKSAQGVLPELGPALAQAGVKGNKFLETIANSASGLDLAAPPAAKRTAIEGLRTAYLKNYLSQAQQVSALGGDPTSALSTLGSYTPQYPVIADMTKQMSPQPVASPSALGSVGQPAQQQKVAATSQPPPPNAQQAAYISAWRQMSRARQ